MPVLAINQSSLLRLRCSAVDGIVVSSGMAQESIGRTAFLEYMKAFEERLGTRFTRIDEQFTRIDERFTRIDQQFTRIDEQFTRIDQQFTRIDERFTGLDQRLTRMDERFARIDIRLEELTGIVRLSFEAIEALRESTDRQFGELRDHQAEQMVLLRLAIRHIRRRVEHVERRRRAKRSR